MKIKVERKILALFLAVAMMLSVTPMNLFAAYVNAPKAKATNIVSTTNTKENKTKQSASKLKTVTPVNGTKADFQIIFTSDLHGTFSDWNYATDKETTGLARIASELKTRITGTGGQSRENTILIDIGDTIQGNGTGNFIGRDFFPVIKGFEYLGYDAEILGNHEFNFGVPNLVKAYNGFTGALLCANVVKVGDEKQPIGDPDSPGTLNPNRHLLPDTTTSSFSPYMIKQMPDNGPRVAIIGLVTPNIVRWDTKNLADAGYTSQGGDVILEETIEFLKENDLADIFIGAAHMSQGDQYDLTGSGVTSVIAHGNNRNDLSLFLGAHGHTITGQASKQLAIHGVKYAENQNASGTMGIASVKATVVDGKWTVDDKIADINTNIIRVPMTDVNETKFADGSQNLPAASKVVADIEYMEALAEDDRIGKAYSAEIVGTLTGGPLVPVPTVKGTYEGYLQDTPLIDLINSVMMHYSGATLAGTAPLDTNANLQPGPITRGGVAQVYKFDNNTLYKLSMTGAQFKQWMEWSYQYFGKSPVKDVFDNGPAVDLSTDLSIPYGNGSRAGYNQDSFDGLLYDVDLTKPVGSRVLNLKNLDGTAFDLEKTYVVACNNYRASTQLLVNSTTGIFKPGEETATLIEADVSSDIGNGGDMMSLVADYIENVKGGEITNACNNNWKFINLDWDPNLRKVAELASHAGKVTVRNGYFIEAIQKDDVQDLLDNGDYKYVNFIGFNDFHGQVDEAESATGNPGGAKFAGAILAEVAKHPEGTMVLSSGDIYQGSAVSNLNFGDPVSEMLKTIGVKYSGIGNHEFDWTLDLLDNWAVDGGFEFLAANIYDKKTNEIASFAKPYAIETINGVKVGIIGLTTTETPTLVKAENVENLEFRNPNPIAKELVDELKDVENCDIVIALTHLGTSQGSNGTITGEAADLANYVPRLDGIISGHTHRTVDGVVNGVPIVQAYYNGRSIDNLSFIFDDAGSLQATTQGVQNLYTPAAVKEALPVNEEVKAMIAKYNAELAPILSEVVGWNDTDLTIKKEVADWADELLYDYLLRTTGVPNIVIQNDGGWRAAGIPLNAGDITMKYMYDLMPFDNSIVVMDMKGSDLKAILDKPDSAYGSALDIWGMSRNAPYINLSDGKLLDLDATYRVMCNDFMHTGGDKFDFTAGINANYLGIPLRDAMVDELKYRMGNMPKQDFVINATLKENGINVHFENRTNEEQATKILVAIYNAQGILVEHLEYDKTLEAKSTLDRIFAIDMEKYTNCTYKVFAADFSSFVPLCGAAGGMMNAVKAIDSGSSYKIAA